ncbi:hypothetical protein OMP38_20470 [Cohnella ginsengisoli]|uniref:Uncharacterized protein n=1 Tax=Cohnella ginsengisoli TaxID=425004 RepID=A0A9X4KJM5_9BACL|nr:hypothetical protein [Cohnella ginsengisoli]MDG0792976.1 hypothetical protein [Cohnella ginsengisoli]
MKQARLYDQPEQFAEMMKRHLAASLQIDVRLTEGEPLLLEMDDKIGKSQVSLHDTYRTYMAGGRFKRSRRLPERYRSQFENRRRKEGRGRHSRSRLYLSRAAGRGIRGGHPEAGGRIVCGATAWPAGDVS